MKIAVLGTGMVGQAIGSKLIGLGHSVMMGSRTANNEQAAQFVTKHPGGNASAGTFAEAAAFGELVFNCTRGVESLNSLKSAGEKNLEGKVLVDISIPLDFSHGMPPILSICNTTSNGEEIQAAFPGAKVVKTLNTMNCYIMVDPASLNGGDHNVFISGNDTGAKSNVEAILKSFGWLEKNIIDLGDIKTARATEMMIVVWLTLYLSTNNPSFNYKIIR